MPAQDDQREIDMRQLFNLKKDGGRSDIDATLTLQGIHVPPALRGTVVEFELKSSTSGKPNISTVRDFGLHYIEKWSRLHWLFGVYDRNPAGDQVLKYCLYGSPAKMKPWFDRMAAYIGPDIALAAHVPGLITNDVLTSVLGPAAKFSRDDAKRLMKNQFSAADYNDAADLPGGEYSRKAMLRLLRRRCEYVIGRGSTLNNPHIPATYFDGWTQIDEDHALVLREMVIDALTDAGKP